jgi:DNA-binding beta-propeller fold protein YncE
MHHMTSNIERIGATVLVAGVLLSAGCASTPQAATPPVATPALVWPEAPAEPRIAYVQAFSRPEDLGIRKGFFERLAEVFVGASDARLIRPMAVAVTADGVVFVADPGARGVHRFDRASGRYRLIQRDDNAPLLSPVGLAVGRDGDIYVADSALGGIWVIAHDADVAMPMVLHDKIKQPTGVAFDPVNNRLLVVDTAVHQVKLFALDGTLQSRFGQRGNGDGEFNYPTLIWRDAGGLLYVTDSLNFRIQIFDAQGQFVARFGHHGDATGDLSRPKGVATDRFGHVYVVDSLFHALQVFDRSGTFLLNIGSQGQAPGEFWLPTGLFVSDNDNIYIADSHNQRVQVLRYIGNTP